MTHAFTPHTDNAGWVYLPNPEDNCLEGNYVYRRVSVRDWPDVIFPDRRLIQLRGLEDVDGMEPDAVTFSVDAERLVDIAGELRTIARELLGVEAQDPDAPCWAPMLIVAAALMLLGAVIGQVLS